MKDILLICVMILIFVSGYFIMKKIDAFMDENQRIIEEENRKNKCLIHIAAESASLINSIDHALEYCSWINPYIDFTISSGNLKRMLQGLKEGNIDILLVADHHANELANTLTFLKIPYRPAQVRSARGICVDDLDDIQEVLVVWDSSIESSSRDSVIFAISNGF